MEPLYKGLSRPALIFGVPLVPFILVAGLHWGLAMLTWILGSALIAVLVLLIGVVATLLMRHLTAQDPHRLNQYLMYLRRVFGHRSARVAWGARSYAPLACRGVSSCEGGGHG